jgi:1,5-anhydro-D-fructose reductase (1,5-anhydro-D-mannitol-forming)
VPHAGTGIEIHGDRGSLVGRGVMTAHPVGDVLLRDEQGERAVPVVHENLYAAGVARFCEALRGVGRPAASGEDGVRSLAVALAVAEACRTGSRVAIAPAA